MHTVHLRGIDIGTSGLKCVLIDDAGQLRASTFREYAPDLLQRQRSVRRYWLEQARACLRMWPKRAHAA